MKRAAIKCVVTVYVTHRQHHNTSMATTNNDNSSTGWQPKPGAKLCTVAQGPNMGKQYWAIRNQDGTFQYFAWASSEDRAAQWSKRVNTRTAPINVDENPVSVSPAAELKVVANHEVIQRLDKIEKDIKVLENFVRSSEIMSMECYTLLRMLVVPHSTSSTSTSTMAPPTNTYTPVFVPTPQRAGTAAVAMQPRYAPLPLARVPQSSPNPPTPQAPKKKKTLTKTPRKKPTKVPSIVLSDIEEEEENEESVSSGVKTMNIVDVEKNELAIEDEEEFKNTLDDLDKMLDKEQNDGGVEEPSKKRRRK